jgi:long-subunit fatty acid transport protein
LLTGAATAAHAQSTSAINGGIQFDFSLPGARSLGMAGAFVAVADDVSAAQANPAGLTVLSRPEISIEFRGWNFYSLSPDIGHAYGNPTNIGTDTVSGIQNKTLRDTRAAPGFFSLAMPAGQWVLAGYFQQFSKFKNRIEENGPYMTVPEGVDRLFPVTGLIELDIVDYGFSVGRRINSRWSVGGGVALYDFTLRSRSEAYLVTPFDVVPPPAQRPSLTDPGEKFGPAVFSDSNILVRQEQDGESLAVAFNAGVTWQPSAKVRVGGAFRQGPNF